MKKLGKKFCWKCPCFIKKEKRKLKELHRDIKEDYSGRERRRLKSKMVKIWKNKKVRLFLLCFVSPLLLIFLVFLFQVFRIYRCGVQFQQNVKNYSVAILEKDFSKTEEQLALSKDALNKLRVSYGKLSIMQSVPILGNYFNDGNALLAASENMLNVADIVVSSIDMTAESKSNTSSGDMLEKYEFILESAPKIASNAGEILIEFTQIQEQLEEIQPEDYPEKVFGKNLRLHIKDILLAVDNAEYLLANGNLLIGKVSEIAGFDKDRKYLVIFQNNKELRPTGGFITAYTIVNVQSGKFDTSDSSDIYDLDDRYKPDVPAPQPIIENLQGPYLEVENFRLRDMNWNPDFPTSMRLFLEELNDVGIIDIDGVIAVDTEVLVDLIDVIGEINVPGYGGYSNNIVELCDCEQMIYELEHFADREGPIVWSENEPGKIVEAPDNYDDRKKIIGPMMNTIIGNLFNLRQTKYPALLNAIIDNFKEKHILFYMINDSEQLAVETLGVGGNIVDFEGDYLHVNDANLGGKKANLYVTHQVDQVVEVENDGTVVKTVELTYRNPKPQNNWLNTVLPNYVRIYVPEGSKLIEHNGFDYFDEPYEELGKIVFAGRLTVRPMGITKVTLKYILPFTVKDRYNLYTQKQPGKDAPKYSIGYGEREQEFTLDTDKEIIINLNEEI